MKNFTKKLIELRKEKGLNQRQLAKAIDVSQVAISLWEQEKRIPDIETLEKLCKFFNVSSDYLIGLENEDGTKVYAQDFNTPQPPAMPPNKMFIPPDIVGHVHSYHIPARSGEATDVTIDPETDAKVTAILRKLDENDEQDN